MNNINQFDYISSQLSIAGIDEVQQFFLAYVSRAHIALSGPPGVGKTTLVYEFASKIGQKLISRVMGPKVNESLIISYPELVNQNGTSVTVTRPGLLAQALKEDAIYFADEIDRLTEDNQKLHNSAFDDRRSVTLRDGSLVKGGDNFIGVIAYNPTQGKKNDLEAALADRFIHINFGYYDSQVEAAISMKKAGMNGDDIIKNNLKLKAIYFPDYSGNTIMFFDAIVLPKSMKLLNPFTNKSTELPYDKLEKTKQFFFYFRYEPENNNNHYDFQVHQTGKLCFKFCEFCNAIRDLSSNNSSSINKMISKTNNTASLKVHQPSPRIIVNALKQYNLLLKSGFPKSIAQIYSTHLIINQATYGKFHDQKYGDVYSYEFLEMMAGVKGLIPMKRHKSITKD